MPADRFAELGRIDVDPDRCQPGRQHDPRRSCVAVGDLHGRRSSVRQCRCEHAFGAVGTFHTEVLLGLFLPFVLLLIPSVRKTVGGKILTSAYTKILNLAIRRYVQARHCGFECC